MRKLQVFVLASVAAFIALLYSASLEATLKHKRETGRNCTFCHTGIPETGDEDPQLNEDGRKFRDNGYELTDEQKKRRSYSFLSQRWEMARR